MTTPADNITPLPPHAGVSEPRSLSAVNFDGGDVDVRMFRFRRRFLQEEKHMLTSVNYLVSATCPRVTRGMLFGVCQTKSLFSGQTI